MLRQEAEPAPSPCLAPRTIRVKGEFPDKRLEFSSLEKLSGPTETIFRHRYRTSSLSISSPEGPPSYQEQSQPCTSSFNPCTRVSLSLEYQQTAKGQQAFKENSDHWYYLETQRKTPRKWLIKDGVFWWTTRWGGDWHLQSYSFF